MFSIDVHPYILKLGIIYNRRLDDFIALLWTVKHMPCALWNALKSLLKSLRLILFLDPNSRNIGNFAN
jgi:hypothetical protein